jgi:uncharacterized damage-inducible protein DinB
MPHPNQSTGALPDHEPPLRLAALSMLDQGEQLLSLVPGPVYAQPSALVFNASIGGHYRHCLDHFGSFLHGLVKGVINYDQRERDPALERDQEAARSLTRNLRDRLELLGESALQLPVRVRGAVGGDPGHALISESSAARELAYVIAHTIHHFALIAVIARMNGIALPEAFGMAPSTLAYRRQGQDQNMGNQDVLVAH